MAEVKSVKKFAAVDLGASSGRVAVGTLEEGRVKVEEVHRFSYNADLVDGGLHWPWQKIFQGVIEGLEKARAGGVLESIGIDSWAVDYGLIDSNGNLLHDPYSYRDARTDNVMAELIKKFGAEFIYAKTGIQFIFFNTAYQLTAAKRNLELSQAKSMLMLPDLLNFFLCGVESTEVTNASSTQLLNAVTREWDWELIDRLEIPRKIFTKLHSPGIVLGKIKGHGTLDGTSVVSVGSHDTASAVAGIPLSPNKKSAYISSGTWSLVGLELAEPVTNEIARGFNITNEVGVGNRVRFIRNVTGLWLLEESIRYWAERGLNTSAKELVVAASALPKTQIIDANDPRFSKPGPMPELISQYCEETNQAPPVTPAEFARCIFDSLAKTCALVLEQLQEAAGVKVEEIDIVGGGSSNSLLNQLIANSTGKRVIAGPVEATVLGNLIVQMLSSGLVTSLEEGRSLIANSIERQEFIPQSDIV